MKIFLTSSNALYQRSRDFNAKCALKYGKFDRVVVYDNDKDIDNDFLEKNKEILSIKRGAGLWLWKIYFVHKALMEECAEGDILFYLDAAGFFFRNVSSLISSMSDDIFAVALPYIEEEFTKAETFHLMDLNEDKYKKTNQFQASYMAFRKSERSINFVNEWLKYGQDINIISPFHNKGTQIDDFHDHRMDQSIFSLLCKKYSINNHPEATQFALLGYPLAKGVTYKQQLLKREYPILIYLHRLKQFPGSKGLLLLAKMFCSYCVEQAVSLLIVYLKKKHMSTKKIVIFTPQIDGHYLEYVHHIYESKYKRKNSLYIFVVPEEFEKKRELLNWSEQPGISFDYLTKTECQKCLQSGRKNFYYSAKILAKHIKSNKADEAIVLTFVYVMPFICLLLPIGFKCKISGIIYHLYPYSWSKSSIYYKVRTLFTYFLFSKSNRIKNIFILNSRSGARLFNCIYRTNRFKYLTDPVNLSIKAQRNIRNELQIPKEDKIILHFGAMSKAKGSLQVMQAIEASKGLINNHTFIFAGVVSEAIKEDFYNIYNNVDHSKVLLFDRFCEYEFVNNLLYTCDTIVIPYIQSGQSSGVVALGAFYHKPLVVLSGGFVGKLVRDYHLGVCIKDNTPESIINGILQLETQEYNPNCDRYVKEHSISEFCNQILS